MRIKAYIMAADPAWIEESVLSYYDLVDEIIVSYDAEKRGWTGTPIAVDECLEKLRGIDSRGKLRYSPGKYSRPGFHPIDNDTFQRTCALNEASHEADWVLQLDTDEVIADIGEFVKCLREADEGGYLGMDYPARWLYRQIGGDRYLEACTPFWGIRAGYPGPVAVKPGARLLHARQCEVPLFRADFRPRNTDPWHAKDAPVHRVIKVDQGIMHYSMVRDEERLKKKTSAWGHAQDRDWSPELKHWAWCGRHPYLAVMMTPFLIRSKGHTHRQCLRIARIPPPQRGQTDAPTPAKVPAAHQ